MKQKNKWCKTIIIPAEIANTIHTPRRHDRMFAVQFSRQPTAVFLLALGVCGDGQILLKKKTAETWEFKKDYSCKPSSLEIVYMITCFLYRRGERKTAWIIDNLLQFANTNGRSSVFEYFKIKFLSKILKCICKHSQ